MVAFAFAAFGAIALTLALGGIYAVLSFIVVRRTREIGVRVALGADRRRVITAIFRRPLIQVSLGVLAGDTLLAYVGTLETQLPGLTGGLTVGQWAILAAYGVPQLDEQGRVMAVPADPSLTRSGTGPAK